MNKALRIHVNDTIIVALQDLKPGDEVSLNGETYLIQEDVPAKHKFAARDFAVDETMTQFGVTVGRATQPIPRGGRIHTSNIVHAQANAEYKGSDFQWQAPNVEKWERATFNGYHRADGSVGTANYWIVVPLVFCENRNLAVMK